MISSVSMPPPKACSREYSCWLSFMMVTFIAAAPTSISAMI
jgi:hypothetical protein